MTSKSLVLRLKTLLLHGHPALQCLLLHRSLAMTILVSQTTDGLPENIADT